ncbi:MAG TPA: hypothetical protein VEF71_22915, partial [Streptosporangiaceae bacterium]|nr:hypothetical protein [Streptosporangiaceae bacterium]
WVALAGAAAGCASQTAAAGGSVNTCFQFGVAAIRHQVTVTALPPACQGLSQVEVNVALDRALQAAAAGVAGNPASARSSAATSRHRLRLGHVSQARQGVVGGVEPRTVRIIQKFF